MTAVESSMLPLGTIAPNFKLLDAVSGHYKTLETLTSSKPLATVVMFICNHCPFIKRIQNALVSLANDYQPKNILFIAINSNDVQKYPEDSVENMKKVAQEKHYPFPYLYDEMQDVAKAYHATCTPDFYIFDKTLKCIYRGQFDDSRPSNEIPVTGNDIKNALDCIVNDRPVPSAQKPSIGCNIKWKEPYHSSR
jgi:thiol-disulfide isomerase/thioredoxin